MSANHKLGPWEVHLRFVRRSSTVHWCVRRRVSPSDHEHIKSPSGRIKRFRSEAAAEQARAVIAKATEAAGTGEKA
jgi:hypothetical protein